jgi:hypothetical protein
MDAPRRAITRGPSKTPLLATSLLQVSQRNNPRIPAASRPISKRHEGMAVTFRKMSETPVPCRAMPVLPDADLLDGSALRIGLSMSRGQRKKCRDLDGLLGAGSRERPLLPTRQSAGGGQEWLLRIDSCRLLAANRTAAIGAELPLLRRPTNAQDCPS